MSEEKKEEKPAKPPSPPQATGEAQKPPASPQPAAAQARPTGPPPPVPPGSYKPAGQAAAPPRPPVPPGQVVRPPTPPAAAAAGQVPRPPGAPAAPPRPAVPPTAPRPATPPQAPPKPPSRRGFIQFLSVLGAILVIAPFVPWGEFLSASIKGAGKYQRQKVVIDNDPKYKVAAGKAINVNDLQTFPPNSHWVITYPSSGDSTLDAQNADTFTKWELIRIPSDLGGDRKDESAFVAFSKVCVHLWCSPNYNPEQSKNPNENGYVAPPSGTTHQQYECPCHGSAYRVPDGKAVAGPAYIQPPPTNSIPVLILTTDKDGTLNIEPPVWDVLHNGVLGYGRTLYQDGKVNEYREAV